MYVLWLLSWPYAFTWATSFYLIPVNHCRYSMFTFYALNTIVKFVYTRFCRGCWVSVCCASRFIIQSRRWTIVPWLLNMCIVWQMWLLHSWLLHLCIETSWGTQCGHRLCEPSVQSKVCDLQSAYLANNIGTFGLPSFPALSSPTTGQLLQQMLLSVTGIRLVKSRSVSIFCHERMCLPSDPRAQAYAEPSMDMCMCLQCLGTAAFTKAITHLSHACLKQNWLKHLYWPHKSQEIGFIDAWTIKSKCTDVALEWYDVCRHNTFSPRSFRRHLITSAQRYFDSPNIIGLIFLSDQMCFYQLCKHLISETLRWFRAFHILMLICIQDISQK